MSYDDHGGNGKDAERREGAPGSGGLRRPKGDTIDAGRVPRVTTAHGTPPWDSHGP